MKRRLICCSGDILYQSGGQLEVETSQSFGCRSSFILANRPPVVCRGTGTLERRFCVLECWDKLLYPDREKLLL